MLYVELLFQLPLKNFKCMIDSESGDFLNNPIDIIEPKLNVIILELESMTDGPFSVEIQYIEVTIY